MSPAAWIALATSIVAVHLLFILWVIAGAALTRRRPWLAVLHVGCLFYGILIELAPWPCPLTRLEVACERRAGAAAYSGSFLLHYLQRFVYPDLSVSVLVVGAVAVCAANLAIYAYRVRRPRLASARRQRAS